MKGYSKTWLRVVIFALASSLPITALLLAKCQQSWDHGSTMTDRFSNQAHDEGIRTYDAMSGVLILAARSDQSLMADEEEANDEEDGDKEGEDRKDGEDKSGGGEDRMWDRVKRG